MNSLLDVTNLGDTALLLPLALVLAIWISTRFPGRALTWFGTMLAAMALTALSKVYYGVTNMPLEPIHFRMISGHMVFSFSVWPILAFVVGNTISQRLGYLLAALAAIGCLFIGYSRLFGYHTLSEVVVGTLLGGAVAFTTLRRWRSPPIALPHAAVFLPLLCVTGWICYGYQAPSNDIIDTVSHWVRMHI
ncbi:hypothetical protein WM40_07270 [Robbsia andropogonis]|uniref:Phosphatidic acid phosphatase type 2/haloperoxidase domain-containing protein n=1 Tax=Robbsia andropogonis TaxID=28092 RepID=A0A0F5K2E4_9BURK|nr:phosphatase PAP2 family protein [Robbsia andropogonis]KKB64268.1 hypothetical protein WM40_07270 [Robbsia andropogonis]MCP1118853.1 phosphatase PAP2 family protein [Robbsia andropogonis]MCP1128320.1 phosphatase PAP2 family protein [Robbsia andropogonis]